MTTQTTLSRTKAPFRADHVGSFLRPESIKKARKELAEGTITKEALREIENVEITRIVEKQILPIHHGRRIQTLLLAFRFS